MQPLTGTGVWASQLRYGDRAAIPQMAAELEDLGYAALWVPDVGGDLFGSVELLLSATSRVTVATGILNLWMHTPQDTAQQHARLTAAHGDRFLVGIGVSHQALIDRQEAGTYTRPLSAMATFLDGLDGADQPLPRERRVLAALGPKMLELARKRSAGAHPYNVTPAHTALAREALGPGALLAPEQAVALTTDPAAARAAGRAHAAIYLNLPNYANNLRRLGFDDDDFADGGSDRLIDALVAWGDEAAIAARVQEHRDAGADHVCIQVVTDGPADPRDAWRALAPALT
ncbi:MAG TPA: TIGR03620 family F420-dependent LLM class oxidoreductase [Mycobacteriales bacterium]|nr:TIGR03620 family F420-dependent LLM class oxidoreductase [Mycobacteriales bacterium]